LERELRRYLECGILAYGFYRGQMRQSSGASSHARRGSVSFIHRFGASCHCHIHSDENQRGDWIPIDVRAPVP
jgi:hypothetical protein